MAEREVAETRLEKTRAGMKHWKLSLATRVQPL